jgi:hypothetical protein
MRVFDQPRFEKLVYLQNNGLPMALPFLKQAFIDIVVDGRCPEPVL